MNIEAVREQIQKHGKATFHTNVVVWHGIRKEDDIVRKHTVFVTEITDTHVIGTHDRKSEFAPNLPFLYPDRPFRVKHLNGRFRFGGGCIMHYGFKFSDLVVD